MSQSTDEVIERLRWLSKEKIAYYRDIPLEYSRIPAQVSSRRIPVQTLQSSRLPAVFSHNDHEFRTLYVSAREVPSLPASAIPVSQLLGVNLKGYLPTRLFINFDGKWYEVSVSRGENWPRLRIAWSSITAMAVRFLHDRGVRDFPCIGKYLSKEPPSKNTTYIAEIGEWYLHPPEGGKPAVEALHRIEKHTGIKIAIEIQRSGLWF